jgi:hypothetical protein
MGETLSPIADELILLLEKLESQILVLQKAAYLAGFMRSGEGFNGEYPYGVPTPWILFCDGWEEEVAQAYKELAWREEKQCPRPKIVCLCGSTRFRADFERASMEEAMAGNIVLSVGMFGHETGLDMSGVDKRDLDRLHFRKIELADEVLIVHPDYMGLSTCDEYYYAIALGKTVRFQGADEERA